MKKHITSIILCLVAATALAQNKSEIAVSYDYTKPNLLGKARTSKMMLLASATEAKYFDEISLWIDSLQSTPEGKAQYKEIIQKACMTTNPDGSITMDMRKGPTKKTYTYVFHKPEEGSLTVYDKYGEDLGYYTEPLSEMEWSIVSDSTSMVLGYECLMAESDYHGRHWKAWFTPEIPMSFGPWKLHGLPGLILKAEANGGFSFTATGLERSDRPITSMYLQQDYTKIDRKKGLENAEYYKNNLKQVLNAQGHGVKVYSVDESGNKIDIPKHDGLKHSLEPDYKMK